MSTASQQDVRDNPSKLLRPLQTLVVLDKSPPSVTDTPGPATELIWPGGSSACRGPEKPFG